MPLSRDRTRINIGGGYLEVSTDGGSNWDELSYSSESKILDDTAVEDAHAEDGEYLAQLLGNEKVQFDTTLLQTTLDEINFIRNNKGNDIDARYRTKLPPGSANKWQVWSLGKCQIVPKMELTFNTSKRTMPFSLVLFKGATTGKYYEVAETTNDPVQGGDWPDAS